MPRYARYVKNKRSGKRGTIVRGDTIHIPMDGLVGGSPGQGIHETGSIQRYDLGTRRVLPDGRVFRYCLSSGATKCARGANTTGTIADNGIAGSCVLARSIGDTEIDFATQTFAKDELKGGYLIVHTASDAQQNRLITGNTAAAGTTVIITIAEPFAVALDAAQYCEVCPNPYRYVQAPAGDESNRASIIGVPFVKVTASGSYFWAQTWGPCWLNPGPYGMGAEPGERSVLFNPDGSLRRMAEWGVISDWQHAGFILQSDRNGGNGPPFVMLQISP